MRITTVISSMTCGGAQRVMSIICNAFADLGHELTLITLDDGREVFYPLNDTIMHRPLSLYRTSKNVVDAALANVGRLKTLRAALSESKPDVVLSFTEKTNVLTLMSGFRGAPIVVSERVNPAFYDVGPVWSRLRDVSYRFAERIVVQASDIASVVEKYGRPISIIPNPIRHDEFPEWRGGEKRIVGAGRLVDQKGFDFLIESFSELSADFPDWRVEIYGDGPLREELEQKIAAHDLAEKFYLHQSTQSFFDVLAESEIFALPSRFEGFPNVLIEAMACGLPTVAFDCPSGPSDILNGENGTLVSPLGDVAQFRDGLRAYMSDEDLRRTTGTAARESVRRLDVSENIKLWSSALGVS